MGGQPLYLEPRLEPRLRSLLEAPGLLHTLTDALGSPLHVVVPDQIAENVRRFRSVYRDHHLSGQIFFAHKANRSSALLRRLAATDAGVDVASLEELQHALGAGFTPDRITATGPKNREFLWLAARTSVAVSTDSRDELEQLATLVRRHALPRCRVLLRLSGFETAGVRVLSRRSRFGSPVRELDPLLEAVERHHDAVDLTGVACHLDTISLDEKAAALEGCLRVLEECRSRGLRPSAVDAGGGFGVGYVAEREQWERYTTELTAAVLGTRPPLTWGGYGYGLRGEAGTLRGTLGLYPAHRPVAAARYLDELLARPATSFDGRPLAALLLDHLYDLHTEPGRALVDQCGLTLATVLEVRTQRSGGELLVRLEAKADDIALEEHGVLVDPVVLPRDAARTGPAHPVAVHLFGSLCLETDLITRRTVFLPRRPEPGDLMAFANTAGYCMDFHATRAQRRPVGRKIAAWQDDGSWRWCLDDQYWPTTSVGGAQ
ncbi:diaminopimelate decarboxylase [Streptomyces griseochromogenes]|uniref:Diaminopimelate decarboxylase n=1 Tax=Streptomyces griseochromogenes TaxID=68214 RepID=A0A1B1B199_9ACTN|nr:alanine racemase [Streptomyces griseochromogenes]ANP52531.1 diaminopimelate decarboxylase [Streptomyces griseochromogenes]MBP2047091.1 diaminopimelate decarboxylase [Streptomyces griseochromogenes]